jgi:uncharacterized protein (UPF0335 family)
MKQRETVTAIQLKTIISRIEKLEEEKANIAADIKDVYLQAKGNGFDIKAVKQIIKIRKIDENERNEQETILDIYMRAIGMIPDFEGE